MTKKNIRPQQVAPVERETTSTAKDKSGQVTPLMDRGDAKWDQDRWKLWNPFAGDDAE